MGKYRQRQWLAAKKQFEDVLLLNENDKAARLYIERCEDLAARPPDDDWDGSYVMESK